MKLKSLTAIRNLHCKRVLVRLDLNVPLKKKKVSDDWKIEKILPTLQYLIQKDAKIVIVSHLGRPNGKKKKKLTLQPVVNHLEKSLGKKVLFLKDKVGSKNLIKKISALNCGGVAVLENIRFYKEEKKNDKNFAKNLGELVDAYVNDAFAVSHRAHASISAITKILPSYAGLLLQEEIKNLDKILKNPTKPFVVLLGGAKMSAKIPSIKNIKADHILLGGALDKESKSMAKKLFHPAGDHPKGGKKVVFPSDEVAGKKGAILDIGPQTVLEYSKYIRKAQTLVWNGPMGYFEKKEFSHGTIALARLIASRSSGKVFGVVGGGETIEALRKTKMEQYVDWISTGGGAMLAFLSGEKLPGLEPLIKK